MFKTITVVVLICALQLPTCLSVKCYNCVDDSCKKEQRDTCEGTYCSYYYKSNHNISQVTYRCTPIIDLNIPGVTETINVNECIHGTNKEGVVYSIKVCNNTDFCHASCDISDPEDSGASAVGALSFVSLFALITVNLILS